MAATGALLASISLNPLMYIAATILLTLNTTIYHPPAHSYAAGLAKPKDRAKVLGILNAWGTFGMSLGSFSLSILMGLLAFSWRQIYLFWVIPIILGLISLYFVKTKPSHDKSQKTSGDRHETSQTTKLMSIDMILFLASSGIRRFGGSMTSGFLSIWLVESQGWRIAEMGLMFGVSSLMGIIASPLGGAMASRFSEKKWAVTTLFTSYTCFVIAILMKGFTPFLLFYLGQRFFSILGMPANASITAMLSPPEQRGIGFALSFLPGSITGAVTPIVAAYVADSFGLFSIFMTSAVIYFIGLGILQFGVKID